VNLDYPRNVNELNLGSTNCTQTKKNTLATAFLGFKITRGVVVAGLSMPRTIWRRRAVLLGVFLWNVRVCWKHE